MKERCERGESNMQKYVALLRGINISGKNKVAMPLLKEAFEQAGFLEVSTYINSGNVLFSSDRTDKKEMCEQCATFIQERFEIDVPIVILSQKELQEAIMHAPLWWDKENEQEMVHQAIFLVENTSIEEVYAAVKEAKAQYEQVDHYGNVIFWSAFRATLSKTSWYKIASSSVNQKVTIRNANTAKKLVELLK